MRMHSSSDADRRLNRTPKNRARTKWTMDQELAEAAVYAPGRRCVRTPPYNSPFRCEMTSWPPSWTYDVILFYVQIRIDWRRVETDFRFDVTISRWRPWRLFRQKSAYEPGGWRLQPPDSGKVIRFRANQSIDQSINQSIKTTYYKWPVVNTK